MSPAFAAGKSCRAPGENFPPQEDIALRSEIHENTAETLQKQCAEFAEEFYSGQNGMPFADSMTGSAAKRRVRSPPVPSKPGR